MIILDEVDLEREGGREARARASERPGGRTTVGAAACLGDDLDGTGHSFSVVSSRSFVQPNRFWWGSLAWLGVGANRVFAAASESLKVC